jgi:hypothetical protein
MKEFMHEHPWMSFFLGLAAIQGITVVATSLTGGRRSRIPPPIPHKPVAALQHALGPQHYTGAVNRGGFKGGAGMPFGPGPWPTNYASENPQSAAVPEMTGWGHVEMPTPFGDNVYSRDGWPNGGGGHGGYPYNNEAYRWW